MLQLAENRQIDIFSITSGITEELKSYCFDDRLIHCLLRTYEVLLFALPTSYKRFTFLSVHWDSKPRYSRSNRNLTELQMNLPGVTPVRTEKLLENKEGWTFSQLSSHDIGNQVQDCQQTCSCSASLQSSILICVTSIPDIAQHELFIILNRLRIFIMNSDIVLQVTKT